MCLVAKSAVTSQCWLCLSYLPSAECAGDNLKGESVKDAFGQKSGRLEVTSCATQDIVT